MAIRKVKHILGPPGTGKTTRLLNIVKQEIASGVNPTSIAFTTFTKKAASEAINRAKIKFNLNNNSFPYFRTIHSYCFKTLGMRTAQVMSFRHYQEVGGLIHLPLTGKTAYTGDFEQLSLGDKLLFAEQFERTTYKKAVVRDEWRFRHLKDTLSAYKRERGLFDFTDMLELYLENAYHPNIDVAILDEGQDLTPLQWKVFWHMSKNAQRVYIAGDDDQAIYDWAGADVSYFMSLCADEVEVLPQSYRVPVAIAELAGDIIGRIKERKTKIWKPRNEIGKINKVVDASSVTLNGDSWLLLARNKFRLSKYKDMCYKQGYVFLDSGNSSVSIKEAQGIASYEAFRKGKIISEAQKRNVSRYLNMPHVIDAGIWHEAFRGINFERRMYYLNVLQKGRSLLEKPKITISTIHGAKGGEADHVVIDTTMAKATEENYFKDPASEHRVYYVGVTRAKTSLHVVSSSAIRL